jgi:hypothetical protein
MAQGDEGISRMARVEAHRLVDHANGFLRPPRKGQNIRQENMAQSIIWIKDQGALGRGDGRRMLLLRQVDRTQDAVGQG